MCTLIRTQLQKDLGQNGYGLAYGLASLVCLTSAGVRGPGGNALPQTSVRLAVENVHAQADDPYCMLCLTASATGTESVVTELQKHGNR